ncbi:hypothetical protein [Candidatus Parabeggiatoa sp. HSG14]|uniref:hypothetical protein n=1 Tax=Candidatus Parabeggiatoa sp. HSG14 TaxID=3055593 RepID=UPI0025A890E1|nr:hypothetical protein [Thiotrichales bacterium HSG14]
MKSITTCSIALILFLGNAYAEVIKISNTATTNNRCDVFAMIEEAATKESPYYHHPNMIAVWDKPWQGNKSLLSDIVLYFPRRTRNSSGVHIVDIQNNWVRIDKFYPSFTMSTNNRGKEKKSPSDYVNFAQEAWVYDTAAVAAIAKKGDQITFYNKPSRKSPVKYKYKNKREGSGGLIVKISDCQDEWVFVESCISCVYEDRCSLNDCQFNERITGWLPPRSYCVYCYN